jgi:hypothetical protein
MEELLRVQETGIGISRSAGHDRVETRKALLQVGLEQRAQQGLVERAEPAAVLRIEVAHIDP